MPKKRVTFTVYKNDDLFQTPERLNKSKQYSAANSQIISGNVAGRRIKNLKNPVKTVFRPFKVISSYVQILNVVACHPNFNTPSHIVFNHVMCKIINVEINMNVNSSQG